MKKILLLALVAAMLLASAAQARVPGEMQIFNCEEWVSLRDQPDATSDRCAQVPLGAKVRGYYASHGDFSCCEYDGAVGYILNEYLQMPGGQPEPAQLPDGDPSYEFSLENGSCVRAWYGFASNSETLRIGCYTETDALLWSYETESLFSSELTAVTLFLNQKAETPMVMVHNSSYGLIALDASTGEEIWILPGSQVFLGASITHAVANDGTMYIGGYYGPDPVCISADGKVKWESSSMHTEYGMEIEFCWLNDIIVLSDGIAAHYNDCDGPAWVGYDTNGKMISWEREPE